MISSAKKYGVFLAGCLIFSFGSRRGSALTFWQHSLSVLTDHYYLTYFLLPMVLLCCFSFAEDHEEIVISRYGSYFSYFMRKWRRAGLTAARLVIGQNAAILLSGLGLPKGNVWRLSRGAVEAELFSVLSEYFSAPGQAFLAASLFLFAGIWLVFGICMWICHFTGRKRSVGILMALYVFSALWIKISLLQRLPVTGFNHLLILHHNLADSWRLFLTLGTAALVVCMIIITVKYFWRAGISAVFKKPSGIGSYYRREVFSKRNLILLLSVVIGLSLYKRLQNPFLENGEEWLYSLFEGHGTGYFHLFSFLEMLVGNGVPLYLLAVFVERSVSGHSLFVWVRLKNRWEQMGALMIVGMEFICFYSALWGICGVVGSLRDKFFFESGGWMILLTGVLLKGADLCFQYLFMIVIYGVGKQITAGFLALLVGNLLCVLPEKISRFLPFGASSLARISTKAGEGKISPAGAWSMFFVGGLVLIGWLAWEENRGAKRRL